MIGLDCLKQRELVWTLRPFGKVQGERERKKKGKVDVCCTEVWRGGQHMACTAFPDM